MGRQPRRDVVRNRARIVDAARRLVAERGLGVSHDEIARAAEVGVATVYRHFPDRRELIELLFDERVDEIVALAEAAGAEPDPWDGLVAFLTGNIVLQARDRGLREFMASAGRGADLVATAQRRVGRAVGELVDRAHRSGQLRPDVGVGDFPMLQIMVDTIVVEAADADPELWRRALALALDGYRATSVPRPPLPGATPTPAQVESLLGRWRAPDRR